ncbi:glyoxalase/bleomycin resistance/dioxygenase family protein [Cryptosporangium sp. NPDC048952]|uniref:glyoxalase/bleomycin resistance/dioxygenase family protein n=1 Tax=Cryptosporangium sp. NPDC048952 TaxID=3363961 RepID=UPI0037229B93
MTRLYHPSHHVTDLRAAEAWFERVFGRTSRPMAEMTRGRPASDGYPTDYSTFTPINDVLFDMIDPKLYVLDGVQRYASVDKPHLKGFGWYVDGIVDAYRSLRRAGVAMVGQQDEVADTDTPPTAPGSPMPIFFTVPESAGLRYEFLPQIPFPLDHRLVPGWELPAVSDDDPLGLVRASHHTVLTDDPAKGLRVVRDALGGTVIHEGRNEVLGTTSIYVHLADAVFEYAIPDEGTAARDDWRTSAPNDSYHTITWQVADLDRVARHLEGQRVAVRARTDEAILTDPETSLGIPWVFTTEPVPGDPR